MIYAVECYGPAGAVNRGGLEPEEADRLYNEMLPSVHENGGELLLYGIYHNGERVLVSSFERPRQSSYAEMVSHEALGYTP